MIYKPPGLTTFSGFSLNFCEAPNMHKKKLDPVNLSSVSLIFWNPVTGPKRTGEKGLFSFSNAAECLEKLSIIN